MTQISSLQISFQLPDEVNGETPTPGPAPAAGGGPATWTLAFTPIPGSLRVYSNGIRQREGAAADFMLNGNTLTSSLWAAQGGDLLVDYRHE